MSTDALHDARERLAITRQDRIPAGRYHEPEFHELERRHLWSRVWQMACRLEEIPERGDFVEYRILEKSIIVVRIDDTRVKAFHNACRHRGVALVRDRGNVRGGFNCPFHGWQWSVGGKNISVFQRDLFDPGNLDPDDIDLVECRSDVWGGFVFITMDWNAPDLRASIEPFATMHDKRNVEHLRAKLWFSVMLPANWKIAIEAFLESYHVMRTHPQLMSAAARQAAEEQARQGNSNSTAVRYKAYSTREELIDGTIGHMRRICEEMGESMVIPSDIEAAESIRHMPLPEDMELAGAEWRRAVNEKIYRNGLDAGLPTFDLNALEDALNSPVNYCFPNFFLLPQYANMASYRVRPLGPEECLFEIWGLEFFPPQASPPRLSTPVPMKFDDPRIPTIPLQDFSNIPAQQYGLHAAGFEYMRLAGKVEGVISNYQRLIDGYLQDIDGDSLAHAAQQVSGPIDGPIRPLGLTLPLGQ